MSKNKEIGLKGESIAIEYLKRAGYRIVCTNYRHAHYEIDIIALDDETLVFIEVKTRRSLKYGEPEDSIDDRKIDNILECAQGYIEAMHWSAMIRFDILTIKLGSRMIVNHIKDAFF